MANPSTSHLDLESCSTLQHLLAYAPACVAASGWAAAGPAASSQGMLQDQVMLIWAGLQTKCHVYAQALDQTAQG